MQFEEIVKHVRDVPYVRPAKGRILYDFVRKTKPVKCLELGFYHGSSSCYIAAALQENGNGHLTSIDRVSALELTPSIADMAQKTGLNDYITPILADQISVNYNLTIKPIDRLVIQPSLNSINLQDIDKNELRDGFIFRTRTEYQFTKELFLRVVVQYNDFIRRLDIEPLLTYKINPFSMFFIGSTHRASDLNPTNEFIQSDRQIFMKFQYLFRV